MGTSLGPVLQGVASKLEGPLALLCMTRAAFFVAEAQEIHIYEEPLACDLSQGQNLVGSSDGSVPAAQESYGLASAWWILLRDRHQHIQVSC